MSGRPKGAKRPLERPLDGGVRCLAPKNGSAVASAGRTAHTLFDDPVGSVTAKGHGNYCLAWRECASAATQARTNHATRVNPTSEGMML